MAVVIDVVAVAAAAVGVFVVAGVALVIFIIIYIVWIRLTLYHLMLLTTLVMQFSIVPAFPFDEMYRCFNATAYMTAFFQQYHLIHRPYEVCSATFFTQCIPTSPVLSWKLPSWRMTSWKKTEMEKRDEKKW